MVSRDTYRTFQELARCHHEDEDWRRIAINRRSTFAIIAPHGGGIEAGTSEIARAVAATDFSYYSFDGLMTRGNQRLHIVSTRFDEPLCLELVASTPVALAIHGCAERGAKVHVGGLNIRLKQALIHSLTQSGFNSLDDASHHCGTDTANICNRCQSAQGVQLELTRDLRASMFLGLRAGDRNITTDRFVQFVTAVRTTLLSGLEPGTAV